MEFDCLDINSIIGFDWDKGNINKNEEKHGIKWQVIEEIFFNTPLLLLRDSQHSNDECRCFALGNTNENIKLFVVFTKRENKIRVISARVMNKKERSYYENYKNHS